MTVEKKFCDRTEIDAYHRYLMTAQVGEGERNYHVFYFLIRGATPEETKQLYLQPCDSYPKLVEGGSDRLQLAV